jgi:hypothetical protein
MTYALDNFAGCPEHASDAAKLRGMIAEANADIKERAKQRAAWRKGNPNTYQSKWEDRRASDKDRSAIDSAERMLTDWLRNCTDCRAATKEAMRAAADAENTPAKLRAVIKAAQSYNTKWGAWWFEKSGGKHPNCHGNAVERHYKNRTYTDYAHDVDCCDRTALAVWTRAAAGFHAAPATRRTRELVAV